MARLIVLLLFVYLVLALIAYLDECQSLQLIPATQVVGSEPGALHAV